jgi:D-alanyl-D-alanine carboxypeptidase/D-alanyl-D-alanine-endopeptidase (penicillin-binding protein 4)
MLKRWVKAIQERDLEKVDRVFFETGGWNAETIPDGWIWQDIGNYYGAGANVFNWRENQYDIYLRSGKVMGDEVSVVKTIPVVHGLKLESHLLSAGRGTGDNAYVYYPFGWKNGVIRGTIPINESNFKISAALPNPFHQFLRTLADTLKELDIKIPREPALSPNAKTDTGDLSVIITEYSPPLDSIIYWFNRKSINLYGEALIKTIAVQKTGFAVTDTGVSVLKRFWKEKGIHPDELNMHDGSGLSPLNRVTTHAQVEILKFAKTRDWFPAFFESLPEYNGIKMKSGTISDVKGFCGYHTSRDGKEYIFSILVNNYGGRTGSMVSKMYEVLNVLK